MVEGMPWKEYEYASLQAKGVKKCWLCPQVRSYMLKGKQLAKSN